MISLAVTSLALLLATVEQQNNRVKTGQVAISLNGGNPVITENEFLFEPGMTVEKEFFIKNEGGCDVWYKLYFENVSGDLADVLDVTVKTADNVVLCQGKMSELTPSNGFVPEVKDTSLKIDEKRILKIVFVFPETATSAMADKELLFDMKADAVQAKNNPDKNFGD